MATYDGTTSVFNAWKEQVAKGSNIELDTIKALLTTNSYVPDLVNHADIADITGECSGNGYARQTLTNVVFDFSGSTAKFTADSIVFTASGGSIVCRRYVVWNDTTGDLIVTGLLNSNDADLTILDGNALTINLPAAGLFSIG